MMREDGDACFDCFFLRSTVIKEIDRFYVGPLRLLYNYDVLANKSDSFPLK